MYYSMARNERNWVNSLAYKRMDKEEEKEENEREKELHIYDPITWGSSDLQQKPSNLY
jgi:hypothetical protein